MTALLVGVIAGLVVLFPAWLSSQLSFGGPYPILLAGLIAALFHRLYFSKLPSPSRIYDGLADLFIHVHYRYARETSTRWYGRGLISTILYLFGGMAGMEGAAAEVAHGVALSRRKPNEKWSEQKRRTDVACVLAAGIAAMFQAPFAAVVFVIELGVGGRTLSAVLSAISAFFTVTWVSKHSDLEFDWVSFFSSLPSERASWIWIFGLAILVGIVGVGLIHVLRFYQEMFFELLRKHLWICAIVGAAILFCTQTLYPMAYGTPFMELSQLISTKRSFSQLMIYVLNEALALCTVMAAFGSVGIIWPLMMMGGVLGFAFISSGAGLFVGMSGLVAAVLGTPFFACILVYELTNDWRYFLVASVAAFTAHFTRLFLKQKPLVQRYLEYRGLKLLDGRSADILQSISVQEASERDVEVIKESDLVKDLKAPFLRSKHPFLPVVDRDDKYVGLVTLDLLQEGLEYAEKQGTFYEVKDLLYKLHYSAPAIPERAQLSEVSGVLAQNACCVVVDEFQHVKGLLFAWKVRAAYDREVARRALGQTRFFSPENP